MTRITLRVLDGADRGQVFEKLEPPITIGREEGNSVQLNDERISRFHLKIQEDQQKLVLTDLESTNGTRINGEDTQLRILRYGDVIAVGRSVLLFGTREQIASRLDQLRSDGLSETTNHDGEQLAENGVIRALQGRQDEELDSLLDSCVKAESEFRGGASRTDDMTMMAIRRIG